MAIAPALWKAVRAGPVGKAFDGVHGSDVGAEPTPAQRAGEHRRARKVADLAARCPHARGDHEVPGRKAGIDGAAEPDDGGRLMVGDDRVKALPRLLAAATPVPGHHHRRCLVAHGERLEAQRREQEELLHRDRFRATYRPSAETGKTCR